MKDRPTHQELCPLQPRSQDLYPGLGVGKGPGNEVVSPTLLGQCVGSLTSHRINKVKLLMLIKVKVLIAELSKSVNSRINK